jgi:two-component system sensor histidine kinase/response regulator
MNTILSTTLADIMSPDVRRIGPDASLQDAARLMAAGHISSLLVTEGRQALGIVHRKQHRACAAPAPAGGDAGRRVHGQSADLRAGDARPVQRAQARRRPPHPPPGRRRWRRDIVGMVSESDFRMHLGTAVFRHLRTLDNGDGPRDPPPAGRYAGRCGDRPMAEHGADYLLVSDQGQRSASSPSATSRTCSTTGGRCTTSPCARS